MNINNNESTQLTVSYELLLLLQWILVHEKDKLKKMVNKALHNGLDEKIKKIQSVERKPKVTKKLQETIATLFDTLEVLLYETMASTVEPDLIQRKLSTTLDQIDLATCDSKTILASIKRTSTALTSDPDANAKEVLFEELIKIWKPLNKTVH